MELGELIAKSFLTVTIQRDGGTVKLKFQDIKDAQLCRQLLVSLGEQWYEKHIQNMRPK